MAGTLDLYGNIALLVGGARPDSVNHADWFSGAGGITGVVGCFKFPPTLMVNPIDGTSLTGVVGIVEPGPFTSKRGTPQLEHDKVRLRILIQTTSGTTSGDPTAWATIVPYRDSIPSAFRSKMQIDPTGAVTITPAVLEGFVTGGEPVGTSTRPPLVIGGSTFIGWDFTIDVDRTFIPGYLA
jgi:hypothetical protein